MAPPSDETIQTTISSLVDNEVHSGAISGVNVSIRGSYKTETIHTIIIKDMIIIIVPIVINSVSDLLPPLHFRVDFSVRASSVGTVLDLRSPYGSVGVRISFLLDLDLDLVSELFDEFAKLA